MSSIPLKDDDSLPQDEEVRRAAELREWIEARISELEQELSRLREMLLLVDSTLRRRSFVSAKELQGLPKSGVQKENSGQVASVKLQVQPRKTVTREMNESPRSLPAEIRELTTREGAMLAKANIELEKITITPVAEFKFSIAIPPFQSFFVNRILKGYQSKDLEASKTGNLPATDVLQYDIREKDGFISEVTIINYRDKLRLNEILNTASWAFARMLEKK